jgi:hypothetical protein
MPLHEHKPIIASCPRLGHWNLSVAYGQSRSAGWGCQLAVMNQLWDPLGAAYANAVALGPLSVTWRVQCGIGP